MNGYEIIKIDDSTWRIEDAGVRFFLLTGSERALLIDSGMLVKNAKEIAESLTDLPLSLLNTHADPDHINGNDAFGEFYMSLSEASNYYNCMHGTGRIIPIEDGDELDLGGRLLRIISLPGHTPGSIAVLDVSNRVLISGDPIQDGNIFMFGVQRELHAYIQSLEKIKKYVSEFDYIYPSHGSFPVKPDIIDPLREGALKILNHEVQGTDINMHGNPVKAYNVGCATFLRDK